MVKDKFYFSNGDSAGSLDEFLAKLRTIDDECFFHHVNEEKNDFVDWAEFCIGDKVLAKKIRDLKDKEDILRAVDKRVNTPTKIKKGIIDQIKGEILDG